MIERSATIGGLNLLSIKITQLIKMIDIIFTLYDLDTTSNLLIKDSIELSQLESGLVSSIFKTN